MASNYRSYEDKNGLLKHFSSHDVEFEVVMNGLAMLKGSEKWGARAKELEDNFLRCFDGLISSKLPKKLEEGEEPPVPECLYDEFINWLREDDMYFKRCDTLPFRKSHDAIIRFFKEIRDSFDLLIKDDRRTVGGK